MISRKITIVVAAGVAVVAAGGYVASRAFAIQGGADSSDMANSVVRITYLTDGTRQQNCSGTIAGDGWVLTAFHCIDGFDYTKIEVQLWRDGTVGKGDSWESDVEQPVYRDGSKSPNNEAVPLGWSDVALLKPKSPMPDWAKTVPLALSWPAIDTTLTQYGYGRTSHDGSSSSTLQKTPDGDMRRISCDSIGSGAWTTGHICALGKKSTAWPGDSGGPLLWWVHGYWQQIGDFSFFYPRDASGIHYQAYWSESDTATRNWIRDRVTGPIAVGTILKNAQTGDHWLVGADGYRHWVPNPDTLLCLTGTGHAVKTDWVLRKIETIPDMVGSTGWATCSRDAVKPTLANFAATVTGAGAVRVSYNVGWAAGRDPVTCHFYVDGQEAFTAQCGTSSSKQFTGLSAGDHSFAAVVTDRLGVASDPSPTLVRNVSGDTPSTSKPTIANFAATVTGAGAVRVSYNVGWAAGRDPVTCHFYVDGQEAFTAQCGTSSSKQFTGLTAGSHSFSAVVTDRFGVASDPSPTLVRSVPGNAPTPKPTISNFSATVIGPGVVGVSYDVGWQSGRDPVTCHFYIDGQEASTAQCGTSSSKQFSGLSAGNHSFSAVVTDRYGVASDPSPTLVRAVPANPPPDPKPTIFNFIVVIYGSGHVGVAYDVGWQSGRDPVTCHFFIDGQEVFTAQCGTHSSKQFYGLSVGQHSFYATVSDRFGVYSDPSPTIVRQVT